MSRLIRNLTSLSPVAAAVLLGYPLAAIATHGYDFVPWPQSVETPDRWYQTCVSSYGVHIAETYADMLRGNSPAFAGGGQLQLAIVFGPAFLLTWLLGQSKISGPRRSWQVVHGDARFASSRERRMMNVGLELGKDVESGRTIRVAVKSNLVTIAPARTGKTSGLLLPNLAAPDRKSWFGPAVVIDPKGDAYRATVDRRRALQRQVHCLDPFAIAGGTSTWNPAATLDPNDIAYLQRLARALLPAPGVNEQKYFRDAAISPIVAAFLAAKRESRATPRRVAELLAQPELFKKALGQASDVCSLEALALLQSDEKTFAPVLSTARQAFQWCADDRLHRLTETSSVDLVAVCNGQADLFVAVPPENIELVAPFLKWLLNDLFTAIRKQKPKQRVIVFVDEAKALGRFDDLITAYGELPGYNASIWTFWQDRSQIVEVYGENGANTLLSNSEIVTMSDPAQAIPSEVDLWSRALGDFTMEEETTTITTAADGKSSNTSKGTTLRAVPLMSKDAVATLPASDLLVIVNSQRYVKRPLRIQKTLHNDERLRPYVKDLGGTAESV